MKQELEKYLFRDGRYTYAILDGASVPELPQRLFDMAPRNTCLYRGDLSPDLVHVAPYLVHLEPGTPFTEWLLSECWAKHWGIFAQSPRSPNSIQKHFRKILIVNDETGNPLLFRFYDPRVLFPLLLTCDLEQIEMIFGPIDYFFSESFDHSELCRLHVRNGTLVETRLAFGKEGSP